MEKVLRSKLTILKSDEQETDTLRLHDLSQLHDLPFKKVRSRYIFEEFIARGLKQALGFVEGYDRATYRWKAQTKD